jgi:hypothetical protein
MWRDKDLEEDGCISFRVLLGYFPGEIGIQKRYCQKKSYESYSYTKQVSPVPEKPSAATTDTDRLTYPHEIRQQRETKRPVQLDFVLHQNVLQRSTAAPLQHQCWSVRVCQASYHHVQVFVS